MNLFKSMIILSAGFFSILFASGIFKLPVSMTNNVLQPGNEPADYKWNHAVKPSGGSFQEKWQGGKWPMTIMPVVAFDNYLLMTGGMKSWDDSPDGKNWNLIRDRLPWKERKGNGLLVFDDRLWIFGGIDKNDSWFSADGTQWKQLNEHAPWSTRSTLYRGVFNNKLWIFSGKTGREDSWAGDIWTLEQDR